MGNGVQPLDPVAIQIGSISVKWYGVIIASAVVIALLLALSEANKRKMDKEIIVDLLIWAIPISIISARIYYVIFEWDFYKNNLGEIVKIWHGGIAIYGALIGAVLTAIIFSRIKKISFWQLADVVAPSLIIAQAIGRWGNFMNQEAHGAETTRSFLESLHLPDFIINQMYIDGAYYQPTFLYESLWNVLGFVILLIIRRTKIRRGELFLGYVIWYSFGRFFIEGMRTDSLMWGDFRVSQALSLLLIVLSIGIIIYRRLKMNPPYYMEDKFGKVVKKK
ncbi:prolipoprotein diacylglyceryl transferase [Listeria monocytogenes]|jgi:prolipoprotein diacylglyceryl transferase|uniref:Phosphatidylglycerol--prolipoprotein diacylglyceryl transferase n=8 Tax=Listeria monocytogenes TaxID=1639 RepID=LGT_LISMO|nr:prolipoprotein diacylglyceryl transferase [Listeria monocytogenes]NP_466005.1 prolipoprotein diacylglyceryl transferase [Listeria monocytogenes EGD-e]Q8Y4G2.1 RecName: Full=Phosphatidylglycerol--prolipoprotein diacylglyceryl transferase [Listeria monocytogenes EGD-e]EAA0166488.1 prolipoprotein diacylglyceryl transferase [Listeria monocytogenes serotype 1/2a]EAD3235793.1 prolipoprotein diacylglyceryl transferase [Listeria monocytogenes CFSAN002202]EAE3703469.1 prolipoprotein diacylglyceryl t